MIYVVVAAGMEQKPAGSTTAGAVEPS